MSDSFDAVFIRNLVYENSLKLVLHGATYHRDAVTWVNLYIMNEQDTLLDYWKSEAPSFDTHRILTVTIDVFVPKAITKPLFS